MAEVLAVDAQRSAAVTSNTLQNPVKSLDLPMEDAENIYTAQVKTEGKNHAEPTKSDRVALADISNDAEPHPDAQNTSPAPLEAADNHQPTASSTDTVEHDSSAQGAPIQPVDDPNLDYASDIYRHLLEKEVIYRSHPQYMSNQPHLSWNMRRILVDWLAEVAQELKLQSDTLFLAVNYIDRFLERRVVPTDDLQLVGITCMWMAAKYEEVYCPTVQHCADMTAGTYSWQQIVHMESQVLQSLDFSLTAPTAKVFLRYFAQFAPVESNDMYFLASYLLELSLLNEHFLHYAPSVVAASALQLALLMLHWPSWTEDLVYATTYQAADFKSCTMDLATAYTLEPQKESAIYLKWATDAVSSVSKLPGLRSTAPIEAAALLRY